ncbi:RuvB-like 2 [Halotydeus destructor]|nr:RuvB-like 2 [Halotydeus destructor]
MLDGLTKAQVRAGDVVAIDRASGKVQRLGRSFSRSSDYDATGSASKFVRCPDGELQKRRQVVHSVTLHDMDVINSRAQGFLALFAGDTGEVRPEVRAQIDAKVAEWRQEGKAALAPGLLFVDECHVLDPEAFAFLGRALESELAPLLVLATNRAQLARAVPRDLLDRLVVVVADWPLPEEQVRQVLELRAAEEEAALGPEALVALHRVALETRSLRYACNLLSLAHLVAAKRRVAARGGRARAPRLPPLPGHRALRCCCLNRHFRHHHRGVWPATGGTHGGLEGTTVNTRLIPALPPLPPALPRRLANQRNPWRARRDSTPQSSHFPSLLSLSRNVHHLLVGS